MNEFIASLVQDYPALRQDYYVTQQCLERLIAHVVRGSALRYRFQKSPRSPYTEVHICLYDNSRNSKNILFCESATSFTATSFDLLSITHQKRVSYFYGLMRLLAQIFNTFYRWKLVSRRLLDFAIAFVPLNLPLYELLDLFHRSELLLCTDVVRAKEQSEAWQESEFLQEKIAMIESVRAKYAQYRRPISLVEPESSMHDYLTPNQSRFFGAIATLPERTNVLNLKQMRLNSKTRSAIRKRGIHTVAGWRFFVDSVPTDYTVAQFARDMPLIYAQLSAEDDLCCTQTVVIKNGGDHTVAIHLQENL